MHKETSNTSLWDIFSDPKRRQILHLLMEKPYTTSALCTHFDVSRFAVMKHLKVLESAGVIAVQRQGRQRWNVLNRARLQQLAKQDGLDRVSVGVETAVAPREYCISHTFTFAFSPAVLFQLLTTDIDQWWPQRQFENSRMILEPVVNGRFYETLGSQTGTLLGTVTTIIPQQEIRLQGALGIVDNALISNLTLSLETHNTSTHLHLHHHLIGNLDDATCDATTQWWQDLFNKHFLESLPNLSPSR